MDVASGRDERARMGDRELVQRRSRAVRVLGHVGERVLAVLAAAAMHVEHWVEVVIHHVHPDRMHCLDVLRGGRGHRQVVHVVGHVDLLLDVREVVDHVVEDPRVIGADRIAVPLRQRVDRLLLAAGHERVEAGGLAVALSSSGLAVAEPHSMVEVDDVDSWNVAAALSVRQRVMEVRIHADHVAVDLRLRHPGQLSEDQVGSGRDRVRAGLELHELRASRRVGQRMRPFERIVFRLRRVFRKRHARHKQQRQHRDPSSYPSPTHLVSSLACRPAQRSFTVPARRTF